MDDLQRVESIQDDLPLVAVEEGKLQEAIGNVRDRLEKSKQVVESRKQKVKSDLDGLEATVKSLSGQEDTLLNEVKNLKQQLDDLQQRESIQDDIQRVTVIKGKLWEALDNLKDRLVASKQIVYTKATGIESRLIKLERDVTVLTSKIDELIQGETIEALEKTKGEWEENNGTIDALEEEIEQLHKVIADLATKIKQKTERIKAVDTSTDRKQPIHVAAQEGHKNMIEWFISNGVSVNEVASGNGWTPLHYTASNGQLETAKFLLQNKANIKAVDTTGSQPIHIAAQFGHKNMIEWFISDGINVNVNEVDSINGWTPLHYAAFKGQLETAKFLLQNKANIRAVDTTNGSQPIHIAAQFGHKNMIEWFISDGINVNVNEVDKDGWTPLHCTASKGQLEAATFLVEKGADIKAVETFTDRKQPIHVAAREGHKNMIEWFISNGVSVNEVASGNGWTPLHYTAYKGQLETAKFLLQNKANIKAIDTSADRKQPIHLAAQDGYKNIIEFLLSNGVSVNEVASGNGWTPLHYAAWQGHLEAATFLVEKGADVNAKNRWGETVLHWAAQSGHLDVVKWLVEKGADINAKKSDGETVLHRAAQNSKWEVVQWLVEKGADVKAKSNYSSTPADLTDNTQVKTFLQNAMRNSHQRGRRSIHDEAMHIATVDHERSAAASTASPGNHVASDKQEETPYRSAIEDNDANKKGIGLGLINENHTNNILEASEAIAPSSASNIGKAFWLKTIENKKHTDGEEASLETTQKPIEIETQDKLSALLENTPYIKETTAETNHRDKTTHPAWIHNIVHRLKKNVFSTPQLGINTQGHKPTINFPEVNNAVVDNGLTLAAYAAALWFKDKKGTKNKRAYLSKLKQAETLVELDDKVTKAEKQFHSAMEKGQQAWEASGHAPKEQHMDDSSTLEDVPYLFAQEEPSTEMEEHHTKSASNRVANQLTHNMAAMANQGGHFSETSGSMSDIPAYLSVVHAPVDKPLF